MNGTNLNYFKSFLLNQKSQILNKSVEFRNEQSTSREAFSDEAEQASLDLVTSVSIHLHERERSQLLMIERALEKVSNGTYGQCECCSEEISEARLKARPFAALCIDCMEEQEDPGRVLN